MCIAAVSTDAEELARLALERHEVGDHLDDLAPRGVAVGPANELVQVVADARDLTGALARSASAAATVHVRVRGIACATGWTDAGVPAVAAFARQFASSAGDTRACTLTPFRAWYG